jgi:hypothetical protein
MIIGFLAARDTGRPVGPEPSRMNGSYAPYGYAGWIVGDGHVVCSDCARRRYDLDEAEPGS